MKKLAALLNTLILIGCAFSVDAQRMSVSSRGEILEGGPSDAAAKKQVARLIQEGGSITLLDFVPTGTWMSNGLAAFGFEASITFPQDGRWPMTNWIFPAEARRLVTNHESYTVWGQAYFAPNGLGWDWKEWTLGKTPRHTEALEKERCHNNLGMISAALAQYELLNNSQPPWFVSTNNGGSQELCATNAQGVDQNSFCHFQALVQYLYDPRFFWCPADASKKPAPGISRFGGGTSPRLAATNCSYLIYSGHNDRTPASQAPLPIMFCPVHGFILYSGGDIKINGQHFMPEQDQ